MYVFSNSNGNKKKKETKEGGKKVIYDGYQCLILQSKTSSTCQTNEINYKISFL